LTNRIARRRQTLELEIRHQPTKRGDKDFIGLDTPLGAKMTPVDPGIIGFRVHWRLQKNDAPVSSSDRGLTDEVGPDRQWHAPGQEGRHRHRHNCSDNGGMVKEYPSKKCLDDGRPLVTMHHVDTALSHQAANRADHLRGWPSPM
jgi:hypothetical protein